MVKNKTILIFFGLFLMIFSLNTYAFDKKETFINQLLPYINAINQEISEKRQNLVNLQAKQQKKQLNSRDRLWLAQLAIEYKILKPDFSSPTTWEELYQKVDVIPPSLAIAQAATESGWGSSRYARLANNYFGQSCFKQGCGMKPIVKHSKIYYEAAKFNSLQDSVKSYINNLNTHHAYQELRHIRYQQRQKNLAPESLQLVKGLQRYSERGNAYVHYISGMVKKLQLHQLDQQLS